MRHQPLHHPACSNGRAARSPAGSLAVVASFVLSAGSGQLTRDPAVALEMRRVLPFIAGTLALHGTAVSLEGLLLAKKDFRSLCATYTVVGGSFAAWQWLAPRLGWGLRGVWAAYAWLQVSRVFIFAWSGGLFSLAPRPRKRAMEP